MPECLSWKRLDKILLPRVETWLLGVGVSVSVSECGNTDVRFQFWFGFTAVEKSVPVTVSVLLTRSFGLSFIQKSYFIVNTNYLNLLLFGVFVLLRC